MSYNLRLLISCPDKKGLIAAISSFIAIHDGNILSADQVRRRCCKAATSPPAESVGLQL